MSGKKIHLGHNLPYIHESCFGWIVVGTQYVTKRMIFHCKRDNLLQPNLENVNMNLNL